VGGEVDDSSTDSRENVFVIALAVVGGIFLVIIVVGLYFLLR